jgi:Beta-propeller domains of methanol dehydrogenase type
MKAKIIIPMFAAFLASACSSSYFASSGTDDLYYKPGQKSGTQVIAKATPTDKKREDVSNYERYRESLESEEIIDTAANPAAEGNYQNYSLNRGDAAYNNDSIRYEDSYSASEGNTYITNNYYSTRLRRFHDGYWGGYYDPFYSDSFYDSYYYDPYGYGPSWSVGFGWGWPYYGFGYGYGYYGNYGYYGGYYSPYWTGYYNGYWGGYSNYGYASNSRYGRINNRSSLTGRLGSNGLGYSREKSASIRTYGSGLRTNSTINPNSRRYSTEYYGSSRVSSERAAYTRMAPASNTTSSSRRYNSDGSTYQARSEAENNSRTYTPTYSKPRTYSRPTYNENTSSSVTRRSTYSESNSNSRSSSDYSSQPRYSAPSSSSYSSGSNSYSSGSSRGSYSSGSSSSSSGSSSGGSSSGGGARRR